MNFEKAFRQFQKKWRQGKYKSQVQKGCVGVGAVCAVVLIAYFMQARQDEQAIEVLRQIRNEASEEDSNPDMVLGDQQILAQYQELFMQNPGRALSREDILSAVWGRDYEGELKIVDVNIRRLRLKIEDDTSNPTYITTVWGLGYKWGA